MARSSYRPWEQPGPRWTEPDDRPTYAEQIIERAQAKGQRDIKGAMSNSTMSPTPLDRINDPNWDPNPAPDRNKNQIAIPDFADHPCPPAARFRYAMQYVAPFVSPWRVRVSVSCAAIYTLAVISQALAPVATIVTTNHGRSPAPQWYPHLHNAIEFDLRDHPDRQATPDPSAALWLPDHVERTR